MSHGYITRQPMTLEQAVERLKQWGCTVKPNERWVEMIDPNGNFLLLSESGSDEGTWVEGLSRHHHVNDPKMMATILDMVDEGSYEFQEVMEQLYPCLAEEED